MSDVGAPANTPIFQDPPVRGQRRVITQEPSATIHLRFVGYGFTAPVGTPANGDVYIVLT